VVRLSDLTPLAVDSDHHTNGARSVMSLRDLR
jgi:hypothetical protein